MRRWVLIASLPFVVGLTVVSCFSPVDPDCSYICDSSNSFHCPEHFWCDHGDGGTSGYCTRQGFSGCAAKPSATDAGTDGGPDSGGGDMVTPGDGSGDLGPLPHDGAGDGMTD